MSKKTEELVKLRLQNLLNKQFNQFFTVKVNEGVEIFIMPVKEDIPVIKSVKYESKEDRLEVLFDGKANVSVSETKSDDLVNFMKDEDGDIIGFQISDINNLRRLSEARKNAVNVIKKEIQSGQHQTTTIGQMKEDQKKRKLTFIKELINSNLQDLQYAG